MRNLAIFHSNGRIEGADPNLAVSMLQDLVSKTDGRMTNAVFSLAFIYDLGKGVPQDQRKAVALYMKAAEMGHDRALVNLGVKVCVALLMLCCFVLCFLCCIVLCFVVLHWCWCWCCVVLCFCVLLCCVLVLCCIVCWC